MTLPIEQRIALIFVKLVMSVLWFFDYVVLAPRKILFKQTVLVLLISSYFLTASLILYFNAEIKQFIDGISKLDSLYLLDQKALIPRKENVFPVLINNNPVPYVTASSIIEADKKNDKILFSLREDEQMAPASTTKLMTALVAFDLYEMEDVLEIPAYCSDLDGMKAWLPVGKKFAAKDLLSSSLVGSSADAACALANGKVPSGDFVPLMNEKARDIGMNNTNFTNAIGFDSIDGLHHSTAKDLYTLSVYAMKNSFINEVVGIKQYEINSLDGSFSTNLYSTNSLLWEIPETVGIKTGTTEAAGEVLIYEYSTDDVDLVIVVMGSSNRFKDTKNLLDWVLNSYKWDYF